MSKQSDKQIEIFQNRWNRVLTEHGKPGETLKDLIYRLYITDDLWPREISQLLNVPQKRFNFCRVKVGVPAKGNGQWQSRAFTKQQIIDYILDFNEKQGRPPTLSELNHNDARTAPTGHQLQKYWRQYKNLLKSLGLKTYYEWYQRKTKRHGLRRYALRFSVLNRDGFRCQYCGRSAKEGAILQVDHIHPRSKGGKTISENLTTACWECNIGKRDTLLSPEKAVE
jgi:hypothetical protein